MFRRWLRETEASVCKYGSVIYYLAAFFIGLGFGIFFGGTMLEACAGGLCCPATAAVLRGMGLLHANAFFTSFVCSFILAFLCRIA